MYENTPPPGGYVAGSDGFDDLDSFGGSYQPQAAFRLGLEALSDGDYDLEIADASLDKIKQDRVARLVLRTSAGKVVEYLFWLNRQEAVNRFGADMALLGFPAQTWGVQVPLSKAIPDCVAHLKGIKFRATKASRVKNDPVTKQPTGERWHDLHVSCRIDGRPMPPLTPPTTAARPATLPPNGRQPAAVEAASLDDPIPF